MKLLLTSGGITNGSIAKALNDLVGKQPRDTKIAFIPTAANAERGQKDWLINDLWRLLQRGYYVDIIELTAFTAGQLKSILQDADVIFIGGGNTFYLSYWIQKSGLSQMLPELLKTKVYAGISAGSMVAGKSLVLAPQTLDGSNGFHDEDYYDAPAPASESSAYTLNLADLIFRPHLNSSFFKKVRIAALQKRAKHIDAKVYALDDNSALKIAGGTVEVVSEGEWEVI